MTPEERERIYQKIIPEPNSGCWLWMGSSWGKGYGNCRVRENGASKVKIAHRVVFEMERGPIPEGKHLDHLCRNPACVNPDHLEPVTLHENLFRGVRSRLFARLARCAAA